MEDLVKMEAAWSSDGLSGVPTPGHEKTIRSAMSNMHGKSSKGNSGAYIENRLVYIVV